MALNVGQDFKQRWLDAPEAVRQSIHHELLRVCELLQPASNFQQWQEQDQKILAADAQLIEAAYAQIKRDLIEQARIRRQQALEQALAEKRQLESEQILQILQHEAQQFESDSQALQQLREQLHSEIEQSLARYEKTADLQEHHGGKLIKLNDTDISSELDSLRLRLELETESFIEQVSTSFKARLHFALQEEIEYILKTTVRDG